jgi:hypothetical protein
MGRPRMWNGTSARRSLETVKVLVGVQHKRSPLMRHEQRNLIDVKYLNIDLNYLAREGITH